MTRLHFRLAGDEDDVKLRNLLRETPIPGPMSLAFTRDPCYFVAEKAGNIESQTMVCCDTDTGSMAGVGARSLRNVYVDGEERCTGYLSMLRGRVEARNGTGLARGYRFLRALHEDHKTAFYFTSILEDNQTALSQLTGARGGLPIYESVARFITYLIPICQKRRRPAPSAMAHPANVADLPEATTALNVWNRQYQFAPVYRSEDILGETGLLPYFKWQDLYVRRENGNVVGTMGVWDQSSFKQTQVASYSRPLGWIRPLHNLYATIRGVPGLPGVGRQIKCLYTAILSVANSSHQILTELIEQICYERAGQGYDYLILGIGQGNPLEPAIVRYACHHIVSRIYLVYWKDDPVPAFNRQIPIHLEAATL